MHPRLLVLFFALAACQSPVPEAPRSEVLVLGMIHDGHQESELYGVPVIRSILRSFDPDVLLIEVPPDRMDAALGGFLDTGALTEPRAARFVEYKEAVFPLLLELEYELVGCAGWTSAMASERSAKLAEWRTTRASDSAESEAGQAWADERIAAEGRADDPHWIHSARYDAIVKEGMEPYDRLFNEDLGLGGWSNINAAHYANIARALDAHAGEGKRFLVTFGAWHKYWFLEELRLRADVRLLELKDFLD